MGSKNYHKTICPHSSHLCIFNFTPNSSFLFPWAAQRVREWGLQLVHSTCSLLLLSPHTLSLLQHGVSLIGSNSSKATSLWVIFTWKSLRNSLLQCGSPVGSQLLLEDVFPCGLLCMGLRFRPGACSSLGFSRVHNFLQGLPTCFGVGSPLSCRGRYVLHCGSPWTAAGQCAWPWFSPQLQGSPCTGPGSLPTPSSLSFLYTEWLFSHFLTPLSSLLWLCQTFCHPPWLSNGQFWVSLVRFCPEMGHFLVSSHKDIPAVHFPCPQLSRFAT